MDEKLNNLINYLNDRTKEYDEGHPTISDEEWDNKYFELVNLERELGYTYSNSPTVHISYQVVSSLEKVEHTHKMLSLDKTKDIDDVKTFVGEEPFIAMCKMDGLTCSLRYENGTLVRAETRGNGIIGENILHNAKVIASIPKNIKYQDILEVDGEIICTYDNFESFSNIYKNPRNFASGSIRLLDSQECAKRNLTFIAWDVITGFPDMLYVDSKLEEIKKFGFTVVPYITIDDIKLLNDIPHILNSIAQSKSYPIDGIVFKFNSIKYGKSLGETAHHFKNAIAFKFYDETYSTYLKNIEWTMGRTGVLTPVAIFDGVDIDGTTVSRASLHNISVMQETLGEFPYKQEPIEVYKANMIIPQIQSAEKRNVADENTLSIPKVCPICGFPLHINDNNGIKTLICNNIDCSSKLNNRLIHFCGKKGLDIKGLSSATINKLIEQGWLNELTDIFTLKSHRDEWIKMPGFGEKSVDKILTAIEDARTNVSLSSFIASLGIPLIGNAVAQELVKHIYSYKEFREKINNHFDFSKYDGFAEAKSNALLNFNYNEADNVYQFLIINNKEKINNITSDILKGKKFAITGTLQTFKNRNMLKDYIESRQGVVVDNIKFADYLINNTINSISSKNQYAKEHNIPIITEENFLKNFS